jgi:hypothetical protein
MKATIRFDVDRALDHYFHKPKNGDPEKGRTLMKGKFALVVGSAVLGLPLQMPPAQGAEDGTSKPVMINRLFTGPDGQTLVEEIEAKFTAGSGLAGYKLRRTAAPSFAARHPDASPTGTPRLAANTSSRSVATASSKWPAARRSRSAPAASTSSKTSPARATLRGRSVTKTA